MHERSPSIRDDMFGNQAATFNVERQPGPGMLKRLDVPMARVHAVGTGALLMDVSLSVMLLLIVLVLYVVYAPSHRHRQTE